MFRSLRPLLSCAALALLGSSAHGQSAYSVVDLGISYGYGVNDSVQVTGSRIGAPGVLWDAGVLTSLGTLGGPDSYGDKINAFGQIVGAADIASGDRRAYIWDAGVMTNLGTLGGSSSDARGLNDLGHVVGASWTAGDALWRPFLWTGGGLVDLGSFGGQYSGAEAVNNSGQVAGWSNDSGFRSFAFRWEAGVMTRLDALSAGGESTGRDINELGWVAGYSERPNGTNRAVIWKGTAAINMGRPPGTTDAYGAAINDAGVVVSRSTGAIGEVAAIHQPWGAIDLNELLPAGTLWTLQRADDINNHNDIVGLGSYDGSSNRGWLAQRNPLVLAPPAPGLAGVDNTFVTSGSNAGSRVYLVYGTLAGTFDLDAYCYGEALQTSNPTVGGSSLADAGGAAVASGFTPAGASGQTVYYHAVELDSCRVSNLVAYTYP